MGERSEVEVRIKFNYPSIPKRSDLRGVWGKALSPQPPLGGMGGKIERACPYRMLRKEPVLLFLGLMVKRFTTTHIF